MALTDVFGEAVTNNGNGTYTRGGITVEAATDIVALNVFAGMAPDTWVAPAVTTVDSLDFINRFTAAEQSELMAANPVWGVLLAAAGIVDTTNPQLLANLSIAEQAGILTSGRVAQILDLSVTSP